MLPTKFGLLVPLLYAPLRILPELVLDVNDDEIGSAKADGALCEEEKYEEVDDPHELDDGVRDRIQHDRFIVFRLDEE